MNQSPFCPRAMVRSFCIWVPLVMGGLASLNSVILPAFWLRTAILLP